jgi:hypothetical protein
MERVSNGAIMHGISFGTAKMLGKCRAIAAGARIAASQGHNSPYDQSLLSKQI